MQFYFKGIQATDKKAVCYDSIGGFRGLPGEVRFLSIDNGKFEIDHIRKINKQGWFSGRDYSYRKTEKKIKRYIVLGDSYSSGIAAAPTWPDMVQDLLLKNGNDSVELYNFSLEGSGIVNWYRIFKLEIIPHYDFDGVILACSSEKNSVPDLDRKFMMMNSFDDATYMAVMDPLSQPIPKVLSKEIAAPIIPIYPDEDLDRIKQTYVRKSRGSFYYKSQKPDLWFLSILYGVSDGFKKMMVIGEQDRMYNQPYENYYKLASLPYKMQYFDERYKYGPLLKEIIEGCKAESKDMIIMTIPDYENAIDFVNKQEVISRKECQFLSDFYHIKSFDGFSMLEGKDSAAVDKLFHEYDRHWTNLGVSLFSEKLVKSGVLRAN
ncbi:unnamed protein product [Sphagnum jensenii]|uniref:SGNH hydrolase-type esterase domain-containing protein n=1 Tax=Sphagnum jensenii TaxID=128206 RepID=A0ABP0VAB8_9BRYO